MSEAGAGPVDPAGSSNQPQNRKRNAEVAFRDGDLEQNESSIVPEIGNSDSIPDANSNRRQAIEEGKDLRELDIALGLIPETEDASTVSPEERKQQQGSDRLSFQHDVVGNMAAQDFQKDLSTERDLRLTSHQEKRRRLQHENQEIKQELDKLEQKLEHCKVQYKLIASEDDQDKIQKQGLDGSNRRSCGLPGAKAGQASDRDEPLPRVHDQNSVLEQERGQSLQAFVHPGAQAVRTGSREEIQRGGAGNRAARFNSTSQTAYHARQDLLTPRHVVRTHRTFEGHVIQATTQNPNVQGSNHQELLPVHLSVAQPVFRVVRSYSLQFSAYARSFQSRSAARGERSYRNNIRGGNIRPTNQGGHPEYGNNQPLFQGVDISPNQVRGQDGSRQTRNLGQVRNSGSNAPYQPIHGQNDRTVHPSNVRRRDQG